MPELLTLSGKNSTLVLDCQSPVPQILYWGAHITDLTGATDMAELPVPQASLDVSVPITLSADAASGLFCAPGLEGHRNGLNWAPVFTMDSHEAINNGFRFHCSDPRAGLTLAIDVEMLPDTDIVRMQLHLTNTGEGRYDLQKLQATVPVPATQFELQSFGGRWCQEFKPHRQQLRHGSIRIDSRYGRTSHQSSPFWFVGTPDFGDSHGDVFGVHLAWSGNHSLNFEVTSNGHYLLQAGELLMPGEVSLEQGESYSTPELLVCYSNQGRNRVSQNFHKMVRQQLLTWPEEKPRPVILNTWEGIYFDHDPEYIAKMATEAAKLGVERFVLDDGWFKGRDGERAALGDWYLDKDKYPNGLEPLVQTVNDLGMEFGIWVEPEMINPDSDLYRAHPDWVMQLPEYSPPMGRYQCVLDLQNPDAYQYIYERMDELLASYNIAYVKWDMNREFVQATHLGRSGASGQTKALYKLLSELRQKHPSVEIESCASGGGRVDMGILQYTHRFWTSDCNDALERVRIQNGFSMFFPPELMGAHIGAKTSHTTGRMQTASFRATVAMFGHLGLELDPVKIDSSDAEQISGFVAQHKALRGLIHSGDFFRIEQPVDDSSQAWMVVAEDQSEAVILVLQTDMPRFALPVPMQLPGLDQSRNYEIETLLQEDTPHALMKQKPKWLDEKTTVSGQWLSKQGLQLPVMHPESALLLKLKAQ